MTLTEWSIKKVKGETRSRDGSAEPEGIREMLRRRKYHADMHAGWRAASGPGDRVLKGMTGKAGWGKS